MYIGAIEAGGTKTVCAVGKENGEVIDSVTVPTSSPKETLADIGSFFNRYEIRAMGVGMFGPINLEKDSGNYGRVLNTPKLAWRDFNVYDYLKKKYGVPVFLDTDVNAAALGEFHWGAAKEAESCLYMTVGTGIGGGFVKEGKPYKGKYHAEMGHMYITKHPDDSFRGSCPYHAACLEGLASGTAIKERYQESAQMLSENEKVWELESYYLAQAVVNQILILSPEKVILGGGVLKQSQLYPLVRMKIVELLNGYVHTDDIEQWVVAPLLNDQQGIKGAMALVVLN
ncbi:ROK family protein [Alkalicoccus daliensis]|uniref:fructokinase n=1 Tax=Alkalicoccus daliensis TaxID=745820 RepID=A0A1H0F811_9BACI|nr:ROK family protein [Alkalicoccus daliensis]SDN90702.1 fructokinase [Alkalicoccus daliensis]